MSNHDNEPTAGDRGPSERTDAEPKPTRVVHEYDGIIEQDNDLPRWWLGTLFGTIIFAFLYWGAYQELKFLHSPADTYRQEVAEAAAAEAKKALAAGPINEASLLAIAKDSRSLGEGRETFTKVCGTCHGANGGGLIGPNLTDAYWLHGGKPEDVYRAVKEGFVQKGMPAWGPQLGEEKVRTAAAYVLSIRNSHAPGGKAPQGDLLGD
jgi:cytochrome c oxidase cbb3-type subunit 3